MSRSSDALVPLSHEHRMVVLWVAAVYCVAVVSLALFERPSHVVLAATFTLYLAVLFLPIAIPRIGTSWFHPLVFHTFWTFFRWVLPRTVIYARGLTFHPALPEFTPDALTSLVVYGIILETLALVATYVGFLLVRSQPPRLRVIFSGSRFLSLGVVVAVIISCVGFLVLIRYAGGFEGLLFQRGLRRDMRIRAVIGGQWSVLVTFLTTACLVWAGLRPDALRRAVYWVLFLGGLALRFASTGSRTGVILPILLVIIMWSIHHRRLPYLRVVALGILALVTVAVLGEFRAATFTASSLDEIDLDMSFGDSLLQGMTTLTRYSIGAHSFYPIIARVPNEVDFLYGASYLAILAAPIPRVLWPNKPIAPGALAAQVFYNNPFNAIPTGSVGEAYWNLHIPGVIIAFLLWGMGLKVLLNFFKFRVLGDGTLPLYVIALYYFQPNTDSMYALLRTLGPAVFFLLLYSGLPRLRLSASPRVQDNSLVGRWNK